MEHIPGEKNQDPCVDKRGEDMVKTVSSVITGILMSR